MRNINTQAVAGVVIFSMLLTAGLVGFSWMYTAFALNIPDPPFRTVLPSLEMAFVGLLCLTGLFMLWARVAPSVRYLVSQFYRLPHRFARGKIKLRD